jgi:hypothetical protein
VSDEDYYVSNAVGYLVEDLNSTDAYESLTEAQRAAALVWVLDGLVRGNGIEGCIESLGQRSDDAVGALRMVGAVAHAAPFERAVALFPTRTLGDADSRLSAMAAWTADQTHAWREAEREFLAKAKQDDLIDNYVRPFIANRPTDFPQTVDDL